jgi:hypothetical protein
MYKASGSPQAGHIHCATQFGSTFDHASVRDEPPPTLGTVRSRPQTPPADLQRVNICARKTVLMHWIAAQEPGKSPVLLARCGDANAGFHPGARILLSDL